VAAAKGAGLVVLAIIIGIVLLQVVDSGKSNSTSAPPKPTTTTVKKHSPTQTTKPTSRTTVTTPIKAKSQLKIVVLNAGAATGAAGKLHNRLITAGYTNQPAANTWAAAHLTGKVIYCHTGLTREALLLDEAIGGTGIQIKPFPTTAPPFSSGADCVVAVGA